MKTKEFQVRCPYCRGKEVLYNQLGLDVVTVFCEHCERAYFYSFKMETVVREKIQMGIL